MKVQARGRTNRGRRRSFSKQLYRYMWRDAIAALYSNYYFFDWRTGGCEMAARAMVEWVRDSGVNAELGVMVDRDDLAHHVIVYVPLQDGRQYLLDGEGLEHQDTKLRRWRAAGWSGEGIHIRRYDNYLDDDNGIPTDSDVTDDLLMRLREDIGPFDTSLLAA